jgi:transposase
MQRDPRFWVRQRWWIIYNALIAPRVFEAEVGHEVDESTIYRFLHRHRWRKLVPRPHHPKANAQEQATFKKPSQQASRRQ